MTLALAAAMLCSGRLSLQQQQHDVNIFWYIFSVLATSFASVAQLLFLGDAWIQNPESSHPLPKPNATAWLVYVGSLVNVHTFGTLSHSRYGMFHYFY
jgi:hypothetical protein